MQGSTKGIPIDTDINLTDNSDVVVASQKAVKTYVDNGLSAKQNSLGFTPEDISNKSTTTTLGTSDTLYPTQNAVKTYVDTAISGVQIDLLQIQVFS